MEVEVCVALGFKLHSFGYEWLDIGQWKCSFHYGIQLHVAEEVVGGCGKGYLGIACACGEFFDGGRALVSAVEVDGGGEVGVDFLDLARQHGRLAVTAFFQFHGGIDAGHGGVGDGAADSGVKRELAVDIHAFLPAHVGFGNYCQQRLQLPGTVGVGFDVDGEGRGFVCQADLSGKGQRIVVDLDCGIVETDFFPVGFHFQVGQFDLQQFLL